MAESVSPETKRLLKEAGLNTEPLYRRILGRLIPSQERPPTLEAEAVDDIHGFQASEDGGGFFGHWQVDSSGLPQSDLTIFLLKDDPNGKGSREDLLGRPTGQSMGKRTTDRQFIFDSYC